MNYLKYKFLILTVTAIAAALTQQADAYNVTTLLLKQAPVQGGTLKPGIGLHQFEIDTEVILTAVAKPGYQFVYWLGDVADPTSSATVAYIDGPKIIIAVFERVAHEFLVVLEQATSAPNQRLIGHPADYARGGESAIGGKRPHHYRYPEKPEEPEEEDNDFPVPEPKDNDFPVPEPVPEPATIVLLIAGSLLVTRAKTKKTSINDDIVFVKN